MPARRWSSTCDQESSRRPRPPAAPTGSSLGSYDPRAAPAATASRALMRGPLARLRPLDHCPSMRASRRKLSRRRPSRTVLSLCGGRARVTRPKSGRDWWARLPSLIHHERRDPVLVALAGNPSAPHELLLALAVTGIEKIQLEIGSTRYVRRLSPGLLEVLARSRHPRVRAELAWRVDAPEDLLVRLASPMPRCPTRSSCG